MTRRLYAASVATLVLFATPLAGTTVAADAGNTAGNTDDGIQTAGNCSAGNSPSVIQTPFGLEISSLVDDAKDNELGPLGPFVTSFVTVNNPGNAPTTTTERRGTTVLSKARTTILTKPKTATTTAASRRPATDRSRR